MKTTRKIIEINEDLCNGCGECVSACAENAIRIIDGKARLVSDRYCDGLGACLGDCPTGALKIVEREAEVFEGPAEGGFSNPPLADKNVRPPAAHAGHSGCPGARMRAFVPAPAAAAETADTPSQLTHWPVQIRLVPPSAPFLQGADLLVAADCVPVAYPNFHRDFLANRVVMMGCPKFDDAELYVQRFADMFRASDIRSVTVVVMQVPCCQGLPMMVLAGLEASGKSVPIEKVVVALEGQILDRHFINAELGTRNSECRA